MSNITPIRPAPFWGGPPAPGTAPPWGEQGWVWDGTQWVCGGPGPPPPCPPAPCPPMPCPPSGFSAVAGAQACYNQSQALYNLVSQVVSDIFAKNPRIIPSPPPSKGCGPILGVTDGSTAAPGEVGEVLLQGASGTFTGNASPTFAAITLSPGDWLVSGQVGMGELSGGSFYQAIFASLLDGSATIATVNLGIAGGGGTPQAGIYGYEYALPPCHVSCAVPTLLTGSMQIYAPSTVSSSWNFTTQALRIR